MRNKRVFYLFGLALPVIFSSCSKELELEPQNDYLTQEQVLESSRVRPELSEAPRVGMYAELKKYDRLGLEAQADFGIGSISLMIGNRGDGLICNRLDGYNKYWKDTDYSSNSPTSFQSRFIYESFYAFIKSANDLLKTTDPKSTEPEVVRFRAEAKAFRAWAYMNLVQIFQFNYQKDPNALGVPIITEATSTQETLKNPRKPLTEVYKFIGDDLKAAYEALVGMENSTSHAYIDKHVVRGLQARMHLLKGEWAEAAEAAKQVIEKSGAKPLSMTEASMPNFDDGEASNMLWASIQTSVDRLTTSGLVNFQSMMCSLSGRLAYTSVAPMRINPDLYQSINESDVRRCWWVIPEDIEKASIRKNIDGMINHFMQIYGLDQATATTTAEKYVTKKGLKAFTNIKFAPVDKDIYKKENSSDFPLMRIEEMYYIAAEGIAHSDLENGKEVLKSFVSTYRQEDYDPEIADLNAFIDEIYRQRRLEFWGEMLPFYDMLRLNKPMERIKEGGVASLVYQPIQSFNLAAGDPRLIMQFPERELSQNPAIVQNEYKASPSSEAK